MMKKKKIATSFSVEIDFMVEADYKEGVDGNGCFDCDINSVAIGIVEFKNTKVIPLTESQKREILSIVVGNEDLHEMAVSAIQDEYYLDEEDNTDYGD